MPWKQNADGFMVMVDEEDEHPAVAPAQLAAPAPAPPAAGWAYANNSAYQVYASFEDHPKRKKVDWGTPLSSSALSYRSVVEQQDDPWPQLAASIPQTPPSEYPGWQEILDQSSTAQVDDVIAMKGIDPGSAISVRSSLSQELFRTGGCRAWVTGAAEYGTMFLDLATSNLLGQARIWRKTGEAARRTSKLKMNPIFSKPLPLP